MANNNYQAVVKRLGIPDEFIHHGSQEELHHDCNYDSNAIIAAAHEVLADKLVSQVG
jgi:1-deoxy-D-xylulose-5-phosphate synthase